MRITKRTDKEAMQLVKDIEANGGHCVCSIEKNDSTLCMCAEFKSKIEDPNFEGSCHCGLFYKYK